LSRTWFEGAKQLSCSDSNRSWSEVRVWERLRSVVRFSAIDQASGQGTESLESCIRLRLGTDQVALSSEGDIAITDRDIDASAWLDDNIFSGVDVSPFWQ
jgi:hypothetical protein